MVFTLREFPVCGDVGRKMNPHITISTATLQSENEEGEEGWKHHEKHKISGIPCDLETFLNLVSEYFKSSYLIPIMTQYRLVFDGLKQIYTYLGRGNLSWGNATLGWTCGKPLGY